MKHTSTTEMIKRLQGLLGTNDANAWEQSFIVGASRYLPDRVTELSKRQVEILEQLHDKHFS